MKIKKYYYPGSLVLMLSFLIGTIFFASQAKAASVWYASPAGTTDVVNGGTITNPWDLQTALNHPSKIKPGDSVYLRGGKYFGRYVSKLTGASGASIFVKSAPGEWAVLDGNLENSLSKPMPVSPDAQGYSPCEFASSNNISIGQAILVDDEVMNIVEVRSNVPFCFRGRDNTAVAAHSAGAKVYFGNPILLINGSHVDFRNLEVQYSYPNRVLPYNYNNTDPKVNFRNSNRPPGIFVYAPESKVVNTIIHDTGVGLSFWEPAVNTVAYGNIVYHNGWTEPVRNHGHGIYSQNKDGVRSIKQNIIFGNFDYGYHFYGSGAAKLRGFQFSENTIFNDINLAAGGLDGKVYDSDFSNNALYDTFYLPMQVTVGSGVTVGNNYSYNGGASYLAGVTNAAGSGMAQTGTKAICYKNAYETGRGHVVVYNTNPSETKVSVNLACSGMQAGQDFEIYDVQNLHGAPVLAGKYSGTDISLPLNLTTLEQPIGFTNGVTTYYSTVSDPFYLPSGKHTKSEFSTFLIRPKGSSASVLAPVAAPTPTPAPAVSNIYTPTGAFDGIKKEGTLFGWAQDKDFPNGQLQVHVYVDKNAGAKDAVPMGLYTAGSTRVPNDVGAHAFDIPIPQIYRDGKLHTYYIWAINVKADGNPGGANVQLPPAAGRTFISAGLTPLTFTPISVPLPPATSVIAPTPAPAPAPAATTTAPGNNPVGIVEFNISPTVIRPGESVVIYSRWDSAKGIKATITPGAGQYGLSPDFSYALAEKPPAATIYTMTVWLKDGTVSTKSITVTVGNVSVIAPTPVPTPAPSPAPTPAPTPATSAVYLEAEDAVLNPTSAKSTLETGYLGSGYFTSTAAETGTAIFNLNFSTPVNVWARVLAKATANGQNVSGTDDSFYVSVDSGAEDIFDVAENKWSNNWQWTKVATRGCVSAATGTGCNAPNSKVFSVPSGSHALKFRVRDANTRLDRIYVTPGTDIPTDTTPPVAVAAGKAVNLASTAWIDIPDRNPGSGGWPPASDWTIESYIKTAGDGFIVGNAESSDFRVVSGKLLFQYYTSQQNTLYGTKLVNDNKWHHVAVVKEGSTVKFYVDGVQDGANQTLNSSSSPYLGFQAIGQRGTNTGYFQGSLCELRIYTKAKTISSTGTNPCQVTTDLVGMVGAWHFTEGSGTSVSDYSGKTLTAELKNGPVWVNQ